MTRGGPACDRSRKENESERAATGGTAIDQSAVPTFPDAGGFTCACRGLGWRLSLDVRRSFLGVRVMSWGRVIFVGIHKIVGVGLLRDPCSFKKRRELQVFPAWLGRTPADLRGSGR